MRVIERNGERPMQDNTRPRIEQYYKYCNREVLNIALNLYCGS